MPNLFSASATGAAVPRVPRSTPDFQKFTGDDFGAQAARGSQALGAGVSNFGAAFVKVGLRLQKQQDDLDAARLAGENDVGVAKIRHDMRKESVLQPGTEDADDAPDFQADDSPDLMNRDEVFRVRANELQQGILKRAPNGRVKSALTKYFQKFNPSQIIAVKTESMKILSQRQLAELVVLEDEYSELAARATSPQERARYEATINHVLDRVAVNGHIKPVELEKRKIAFHQETSRKNMDFIRREHPDSFLAMDKAGAFKDVPADAAGRIRSAFESDESARDMAKRRALRDLREAQENQILDAIIANEESPDDPIDVVNIINESSLTADDKIKWRERVLGKPDTKAELRAKEAADTGKRAKAQGTRAVNQISEGKLTEDQLRTGFPDITPSFRQTLFNAIKKSRGEKSNAEKRAEINQKLKMDALAAEKRRQAALKKYHRILDGNDGLLKDKSLKNTLDTKAFMQQIHDEAGGPDGDLTASDLATLRSRLVDAGPPRDDVEFVFDLQQTLETVYTTAEQEQAAAHSVLKQIEKSAGTRLAASTAARLQREANALLRGKNLFATDDFKLGDTFAKEALGWKGGIVQEWTGDKNKGLNAYMRIRMQVMREMRREANPLRGPDITKRFIELAQPAAFNKIISDADTPSPRPAILSAPGMLEKYRGQTVQVDRGGVIENWFAGPDGFVKVEKPKVK